MWLIITQMLFCLFAAGLLGSLIGWLLKSLFGSQRLGQLEESWVAKLRVKNQELESLRTEAQGQVSRLESGLADWGSRYKKLQDEFSAKSALFGRTEQEAGTLRDKLIKAETELQGRAKSYAGLESELGAMRLSFAGRESDLLNLRNRLVELEPLGAQLSDCGAKLRALETSHHKMLRDKDGEIGKLKQRASELEPLTARLKEWEVKYETAVRDKDGEISRLKRRTGELEPLSAKLKDAETKYQSIVRDKDAEIGRLKLRISELEQTTRPPLSDLIDIEGIGEVYYQKLVQVGVSTQADLLKQGATPHGRKELARRSGIVEALILRWINHVDLTRIKGVNEQYAELLEAAGVDTVPELAQRIPENLYQKLVSTNEEKHLSPQTPSAAEVSGWVAQAKHMPRVINY